MKETVKDIIKYALYCVRKENIERYKQKGYEEEEDKEKIKVNVPVECRDSHILMKKKEAIDGY